MSRFFDWLFGRSLPPIGSPDELFRALAVAVTQRDSRKLGQLCRANEKSITEHFATWQKVPEAIRNDQSALQRYGNTLVGIAQCFQHVLKRPELMQALIGAEDDNPILYWQNRSSEIAKLQQSLQFGKAEEMLRGILAKFEHPVGDGPQIKAQVLGTYGIGRFQQGETKEAREYFQQALSLCEQQRDEDGIRAYLSNLFEVHRYRDESQPAAAVAERLATTLQQTDPNASAWYKRQSQMVRVGEPLNRAVARSNGTLCELDMLPASENQRVSFEFYRNRITLQPAAVYTRHGDEAATNGKVDEALAAYQQAAEADPFDPNPHYQRSHLLMLENRCADAIEACHTTETLAPGWYQCREAQHLAEQNVIGRIDHELILSLAALDDAGFAPAKNVAIAEGALKAFPDSASLLLRYGRNLARVDRTQDAIAALTRGLDSADSTDVETRLCVELAAITEPSSERTSLLQRARNPEGNLIAAAMATVIERQFS